MTAASHCESKPCFSFSVAERAFTPAMHHRLGSPLHYQLTNTDKAPLIAVHFFFLPLELLRILVVSIR